MCVAISTEIVQESLDQIQRVSEWPVQALNLALFCVILVICFLYLRSARADLQRLQKENQEERKEYVGSLKTMSQDMSRVIERNSMIFERIDRRLNHMDK